MGGIVWDIARVFGITKMSVEQHDRIEALIHRQRDRLQLAGAALAGFASALGGSDFTHDELEAAAANLAGNTVALADAVLARLEKMP